MTYPPCHDRGLSISTHLEYDEPPKQTPAGWVKSLVRDGCQGGMTMLGWPEQTSVRTELVTIMTLGWLWEDTRKMVKYMQCQSLEIFFCYFCCEADSMLSQCKVIMLHSQAWFCRIVDVWGLGVKKVPRDSWWFLLDWWDTFLWLPQRSWQILKTE